MTNLSDQFRADSSEAARFDREDNLQRFRDEFVFPSGANGEPVIYFCGNSLGLQPKGAAVAVEREMSAWREMAVHGHFMADPAWVNYEDHLRDAMASIVGAQANEVVIMNALTVNLHLLMATFYRPEGSRRKILLEAHAFPSDRYAAAAQAKWHGLDPDDVVMELPADEQGITPEDALEQTLQAHGDEIALVLLPGIQYATGQRYDLHRAGLAAKRAGCVFGVDLAHAVGNVPVALHNDNCDFAVWCTYKYLNAGPGSTAGAFIHEKHHQTDRVRLSGWFGNASDTRFEMRQTIDPAPGAGAWVVSNPAILSTAPLGASLELFQSATLPALRNKSIALTGFLEQLIDKHLAESIDVLTPKGPENRGAQLSLRVRRGKTAGRKLFEAMSAADIVADWREPDIIRLAPTPLYNSFHECLHCVQIMQQSL